jgi:prepilin-type N-terminal cleavage/methylation domain-containing protein/prepilin-type processing-associated H-X9-DG protein
MTNNYSTRKAFTLIELLVVIAIIAILAAILFPVFAQARIAAKKTVSLSNVKQLGLAITMYNDNFDDTFAQSEVGTGATYYSWASAIFPYVKSGDKVTGSAGVEQNLAQAGLFLSPGSPRTPRPGVQTGAQFTYGVHRSLFVDNFANVGTATPNPGVSQSVVESPADLISLMEKGTNSNDWNYPWFHDWQSMWSGPVLTTIGDPSTYRGPGQDVYTPGSPVYSPLFDSDCGGSNGGKWECAAHARYRYTQTVPVLFVDGHASAKKKKSIEWFKNIWIDRRNINTGGSAYAYLNGAGWGFPGIR